MYLLLGDDEDGAGTSSSGKMTTSEDDEFSLFSRGKEFTGGEDFLASMSWERERKSECRDNISKALILIKTFLNLIFRIG